MIGAPVLFDTSVYIPYLRGEAYRTLIEHAVRAGRVRLSAVVLAELYAGTRTADDKADLDAVRRGYESLHLLVVPTADDWASAGQAIRRHRRVHGEVRPRDHIDDVLILISSARAGAEVVTENASHFTRWASLFRRMGIATRVREVHRRDHVD
ncbi:MAG: PIN domain-containing protein [Deltaproteobacteria bacterium]|nr:PIN domain-containing protein [Deltaproteobacteria bacterium]